MSLLQYDIYNTHPRFEWIMKEMSFLALGSINLKICIWGYTVPYCMMNKTEGNIWMFIQLKLRFFWSNPYDNCNLKIKLKVCNQVYFFQHFIRPLYFYLDVFCCTSHVCVHICVCVLNYDDCDVLKQIVLICMLFFFCIDN